MNIGNHISDEFVYLFRPIAMNRLTRLSLFLLLLFPLLSYTQTYVGFKAGILKTPYFRYDWHKYESYDVSFHNSFSLGAEVNKHVSKVFSLGMNLGYDNYHLDYKMSWWGAFGPTLGRKDYSIRAGYLSLYFYPQFTFGNKVSFYFNFGPYIGIRLHSTARGQYYSYPSDGGIVDEYREGDANQEIDQVSIALMQSYGINIKLKEKWSVFTEFNLKWGTSILSGYQFKAQVDLKFNVGFTYKINDKRFDFKTKRPSNY